MKFAVIKSGGKQYLVHENDEVVVDLVTAAKDAQIEFDSLLTGDTDKGADIEIGAPFTKAKVKGTVMEHLRGDKVRVARFRAKSRYRKVTGFRAELSRVKIISI